ncbi:DUF805 domain-containing protein [Halopseudomonas pachastrellae]|uniref:DUF805 domain-containing protein n=1 Tax=Halopseudomonas pachastrellae TaxID=254161 RepID=UPI003D7E6D40
MNRIEPVLDSAPLTADPRPIKHTPSSRRARSGNQAQPSFIEMHGRLSLPWYWLYHRALNLMLPMPFYAAAWILFSHDLHSLLLCIGSIYFFHCWLAFSLIVRRLHDLNLSGWWSLLCLTPLGLPLCCYLLVWPGRTTANRFGPSCQAMTRSQRYFSLGLLGVAIASIFAALWLYGEQIHSVQSAMRLALQQLL